jgi:AcrR family transcriptional regulator
MTGMLDRRGTVNTNQPIDRSADDRILDATLAVLAREGVAGVSMRAVAREADVAVGLANYYFVNKTTLISAALRRVGEQDAALVAPARAGDDPADHLHRSLQRALDPAFLARDYLSLRLQLWALAGVEPEYAEINRSAQKCSLEGLADLIHTARPRLDRANVEQSAADILIEQNGVWLTAILITDQAAIDRAVERCIDRAFG